MLKKNFFSVLFIVFASINGIRAGTFWSDPLTGLREGIVATINSGIDQLTKNFNEANNQVRSISEHLILASEEVAQVIYNRVIGLLKTMEDGVNKLIIPSAGTNGKDSEIDFSECKRMSEGIILLASVTYSNFSNCVVEKIELADGYGESIRKITHDAIEDFSMIKDDMNQCSNNLESGLKSKTNAILCLNKVGARATWMTLNNMLDVVTNVTNLISKMITLEITLPQCAVTHGIDNLLQKYTSVYEETKKCVDEKKNRQNELNNLQ